VALSDLERSVLQAVVDLDGQPPSAITARVVQETGVQPALAHRILRALEASGFAGREVDANKSAQVIFATQAGRDALA
jgi:hypothetical protein